MSCGLGVFGVWVSVVSSTFVAQVPSSYPFPLSRPTTALLELAVSVCSDPLPTFSLSWYWCVWLVFLWDYLMVFA